MYLTFGFLMRIFVQGRGIPMPFIFQGSALKHVHHLYAVIFNGRLIRMDISRRLGILVMMGVPAIVGGGIVYAVFNSYTPMWVYEMLLLLFAGALISK
jgi:hypothetical protein